MKRLEAEKNAKKTALVCYALIVLGGLLCWKSLVFSRGELAVAGLCMIFLAVILTVEAADMLGKGGSKS